MPSFPQKVPLLLLAAVLPFAPLARADFTDSGENTYADSISYLQQKGVVQGYANGEFRPSQPVLKAEWVKMMLANYDFDPAGITTFNHPFTDVDNTSWYAPYVERAWEMGMVPSAETFGPEKTMTRVDAGEMMIKFLGLPMPKLITAEEWNLDYEDVQSDSWFAPIVWEGLKNNLWDNADPTQTAYFGPFKRLTRGEAAKWIQNMDVYLYGNIVMYTDANATTTLFGEEDAAVLTETIPHLDIFLDVWVRIHETYYGRDTLDDERLIYEAIAGMVAALGDEHSVFFDPPETEVFDNYLEGQLSGIGAQLMETEEGVIIQNFLEGSPAENSGLHVNDRIVEVDGIDVSAESAEAIVQLVRGEAGTEVTLGVEREGSEEIVRITLTRAVLDLAYTSGEVMGDVLYVDINMFDALSFIDFTQTVRVLKEENPDFKGFILDVRDNPGGYLDAVHSVIGHFVLRGNTVFYVNDAPNHSYMYMSTGEGEYKDYPVVVLVNENSASAAEILAIVLKEKQGAILVGQQTYGKGTVQELVDYGDGSSLKLTTAEWRSPKFHSINGIGISPHEVVDYTLEDVLNGVDPQLEKALEVIQREIEEKEAEAAAAEEAAANTTEDAEAATD